LNVKLILKKRIVLLLQVILLLVSFKANAQDDDTDDQDSLEKNTIHKGFHAGLFIGAYRANSSTAYLYDGYGFDINGQRNDFNNSVLYNQIVNVYGNGNNDLIAQLLNVNHTDWHFTQQNMPINLKYTTTYIVGFNTRYQLNKKENITLNVNGSKLAVNGKFTISSTPTTIGFQTPGGGVKQNQFTIVGAEQRLMFQFGYQRIIGKSDKINFLLEGGINVILSKAQKNQALLNSDVNPQYNIYIDLMNIYNQPPYRYYSAKYLIGAGVGAFAGIGISLNVNPKYTVQLLYSPSYDRISLGYNAAFKLQHGFGLRIYYNFSKL